MLEGSPSPQPRNTLVAGLAQVLSNSNSGVRVGAAARTVDIGAHMKTQLATTLRTESQQLRAQGQ
eukprot:11640860-Prorocentrum_lima.AAC.1